MQHSVAWRVALLERATADAGQLPDRRLVTVGEIRIAVAELLGQVELEPLGERGRPLGRGAIDRREALDHLGGCAQDALPVPAPLALAAVERRPAANRDERVLQERASGRVRVHVAGGDRRHAEMLREIAQQRRAAGVAALERPLQLDEEAVAAERLRQPGGAVRIAQAEAIAGAAGEADEALAVSRDDVEGDLGRQRL